MIERIRNNPLLLLSSLLLSVAVTACAAEQPADNAGGDMAEEPAAEEPSDDMAASAEPDVYFVNIEDGGTYTSPLEIIFGVDDFDIVPVEDPPVVRQSEGHFHLAYDVPCSEPGEIIPAGSPNYIHFGDGSDRITMQFEPGEHELCLQVADGEHRVYGSELSELTERITITIEAEDS